jgi:hypothetical protein
VGAKILRRAGVEVGVGRLRRLTNIEWRTRIWIDMDMDDI